MLTGHANYVQGVAWDPYNEVVLTQSADRSIKMFPVSPVCMLHFMRMATLYVKAKYAVYYDKC